MAKEERTVCYDRDLEIEAYRFKGIMQRFPNHFHEHYVIGYIESGERRLTCKNKEYIVTASDLMLFNPMDNHTCEQTDESTLDYKCINIKPEIMRRAAAEVTGRSYLPQFTQTITLRCEHVALLKELHQAIMEEQGDFQKEETFLFLIKQLIEEYSQMPVQAEAADANTAIEEVCGYINSHFAEPVKLDDLSRLTGMNKYTLLRTFTKAKGITPYCYLETVRINKAKELLEEGAEPLDAALQTGFSDQSHFTKYFKEFIGLTPKQYRKIFTGDDK